MGGGENEPGFKLSNVPLKPISVPEGARWIESDEEWEHGEIDHNQQKQGQFKYWRKDGTLANECYYKNDKPHGEFLRFHESGEVSQSGTFVDGHIDGERVFVRTDSATTEKFVQGVDKRVWKCIMTYDHGKLTGARAFDKDGNELTPEGDPLPQKPSHLPAAATYNTQQEVFFEGAFNNDGSGDKNRFKVGEWRYWDKMGNLGKVEHYNDQGELHGEFQVFYTDGTIQHQGQYQEGRKEGEWKSFYEDGTVQQRDFFESNKKTGTCIKYSEDGEINEGYTFKDGKRHGKYFRSVPENVCPIPEVVYKVGEYVNDKRVGVVAYVDKDNKVLRSYDIGQSANHEEISASILLDNQVHTADFWRQLKKKHIQNKDMVEALICAVREAAATEHVYPIYDFLRFFCVPLSYEVAVGYESNMLQSMEHVTRMAPIERACGVSIVSFCESILDGARPDMLFRQCAILLDQSLKSVVAYDFIRASQLLQPDNYSLCFTSSLICMSLGLFEEAEEEAKKMLQVNEDDGLFLRHYLSFLSSSNEFFPLGSSINGFLPPKVQGNIEICRKLDDFVDQFDFFLARIMKVRSKLISLGVAEDERWLVKDLSQYFLKEVRDWNEVELPPECDVETDGIFLPDLVRLMKQDWAALTTLCYLAGLNEFARPSKIEPPQEFAKFASLMVDFMDVCFRTHEDQSIPDVDYEWRGIKLKDMRPYLVVEDFGKIVRSILDVLAWACNTDNESPFHIENHMIFSEKEEEDKIPGIEFKTVSLN